MAHRPHRATTLLFPAAALIAGGLTARARAAVPVEQVEAYEVDAGDDANNPTRYSPVPFYGSSTVTTGPGDQGGVFANITFHAVPSTAIANANSNHAYGVGEYFYGAYSPAYGSVKDVYATNVNGFLNANVVAQGAPAPFGTLPNGFDGGALVVNNSYVGTANSASYPAVDIDVQRRIDFMVARADVTFVAAAVTGVAGSSAYNDLVWSSFNALAVTGNGSTQNFAPGQTFATTGSKTHADLYVPGDASFSAAITSGYAAALVARAQAAGQTDANRGVVIRSLLMAGADKSVAGTVVYTRQTANNLDTTHGAGQSDYATSLSILNGGEKSLTTVTGGSAAGTPATTSRGWAEGVVTAGGQSVLLLQAANAITGLTASLNWDVTQAQQSTDTVDTTNAGVSFPVLSFELRPVTLSNGRYVLGTAQTTAALKSAVTTDNVQYLYSTGTLAAGTYALVVTGDATGKSPNVGLSYLLAGTFASNWASSTGGSWGTPANWTNGVPDAQAAVANFASSPGLTVPGLVTLDGNRTVGRLSFNNAVGYTVTPGSGGTLVIDDAGASSGTPSPSISVLAGSHVVTAPIALAAGVTVTTAATTSLSLTGPITGTGGLNKAGAGTLTLTGADAYGTTTVTAGQLTVGPTATLGGDLAVTGGTATFAGNAGTVVLARSAGNVSVAGGGTVALSTSATRSVLVATSLSFGGTVAGPTGRVDLANGDAIVRNGNLAVLTAATATGFANGTFAGNGLTSTAAAANAQHTTTIGVVQNAGSLFGTFDNQSVAAADVLVKYTYYGDADLSGTVNGQDYSRIDVGYASQSTATKLTGWFNGDFNYDGKIDGSDYTLIDNAFNLQRVGTIAPSDGVTIITAAAAAQVAAVPEPGSAVAVAVTAGLLVGRRRGRRA